MLSRIFVRGAGALAAALLMASSSSAQPPAGRAPPDRQVLTELAYTLGQAHALRQLCAGRGDGTWYGRMRQLIAAEAPEDGFRRRLVESFNAGYQTHQSEFPACGRESRAAERQAAARGALLARSLSSPRGSD